jgi:hypothetical protein
MKKSFRPSNSMKSSSPKPMKVSFPKPMKSSSGSHESFSSSPGGFKQAKQGSSFMPGSKRAKSSWTTPLIVLLVLFVCCLVVLCIAGVYLFSQGLISLPSFG